MLITDENTIKLTDLFAASLSESFIGALSFLSSYINRVLPSKLPKRIAWNKNLNVISFNPPSSTVERHELQTSRYDLLRSKKSCECYD
uniref:Ovule protein n=1 Tax=Heterorhabditis bacteriophora TaxID=37862 RepID=A0A1I7WGK3_HETBA